MQFTILAAFSISFGFLSIWYVFIRPLIVADRSQNESESEPESAAASSPEEDPLQRWGGPEEDPLRRWGGRRVHQRLNQNGEWINCETSGNEESLKFEVCHRHHNPTTYRPVDTIVKLHNKALVQMLKGCLPSTYLDVLLDLDPEVEVSWFLG